MTLTELRVWHWRKVLSFRSRGEKFDQRPDSRWARSQAKAAHRRANWHLGAVQAMNDIPELRGTTAEQDSNLMSDMKIREAADHELHY